MGEAAKANTQARVGDLLSRHADRAEADVELGLERPLGAAAAVSALLRDGLGEAWELARAVVGWVSDPAALFARLAPAAAACDDFGVENSRVAALHELLRPLLRALVGLRIDGHLEVDEPGGILVACNRSPWPWPVEALALAAALTDRGGDRPVYALWPVGGLGEAWLGDLAGRLGVLAAHPANAAALLERGALVIGFPEGAAAATRTYERRYRLSRFDDAGLLDAAASVGARIVPAALLGAEESYPVLGRAAGWPLTPVFPLAGAAGLAPLPVTWRLRLGTAVPYGLDAEDALRSQALRDAVRARIQSMLADLIQARRSIVMG